MQQENNFGAFQSKDSFYQRYLSNQSIDRFRIKSNSPSLQNRTSLIEAMDLQDNNRNSDLYENILGDRFRSSNYKRSSNVSRGEGISEQQCPMDQQIKRKSNSQKILHDCSCDSQCNKQHCVCFLFSNEMCLAGLCCPNCIKMKNQTMNGGNVSMNVGCFCKNIKCLKMYCSCYREGRKCEKNRCECQGCQNTVDGLVQQKRKQKNQIQIQSRKKLNERGNYHLGNHKKPIIDSKNYQFINCSCKKSHCLKKYCTCYLNGKQCNEFCTCQQCKNKLQQGEDQSKSQKKRRIQRFGRCQSLEQIKKQQLNQDIDQFLDEEQVDYTSQQLHKNMYFQPVNFQNAGKLS